MEVEVEAMRQDRQEGGNKKNTFFKFVDYMF